MTPAESLVPLMSGAANIAVSTLDSVIAANDKRPGGLKIIALIDSSNGADAMIAKPSITSIKMLAGKQISVALGQASHLLALKALESAGMSAADVKFIDMDPGVAGSAFVADKLDACVTWEPWITKATSKGHANVLYSTSDLPETIINAVVVTAETAEKKPEYVAKFLTGLGRGFDYASAHPDETAEVTGRRLEQSKDEVLVMMSKDKLINLPRSKELMGTAAAPGPIYKTADSIAKFLKDNDVVSNSDAADGIFDSSFLK
jgi:NitT/TauT family transport system substrate-binding protein